MIEQIVLQDFKVFQRARIRLARLTVLVGPNASGKSSVLEALHYASQLGYKSPEQIFFHSRDAQVLSRTTSKERFGIDLRGIWGEATGTLLLRPPDKDAGRDEWQIKGRWAGEKYRGQLPTELKNRLKSAALLSLQPSRLAAPCYSEKMTPRVEYDGEGLAVVLADMKLNQPNDYEKLLETASSIVPSLRAVRFRRARVNYQQKKAAPTFGDPEAYAVLETERIGTEMIFDMAGGRDIPASNVSEGTLLTLGLLTFLLGPHRPRLLLIDDIERGLHPKACGDLIRQLRLLLEEFPDLQIVATSHSPYLLDHLKPEEIRLTSLLDDGTALVAELTDHPEFKRWKDLMSPGEFWSTVGEDWVVQATGS